MYKGYSFRADHDGKYLLIGDLAKLHKENRRLHSMGREMGSLLRFHSALSYKEGFKAATDSIVSANEHVQNRDLVKEMEKKESAPIGPTGPTSDTKCWKCWKASGCDKTGSLARKCTEFEEK